MLQTRINGSKASGTPKRVVDFRCESNERDANVSYLIFCRPPRNLDQAKYDNWTFPVSYPPSTFDKLGHAYRYYRFGSHAMGYSHLSFAG